jgi:hypothetical protein
MRPSSGGFRVGHGAPALSQSCRNAINWSLDDHGFIFPEEQITTKDRTYKSQGLLVSLPYALVAFLPRRPGHHFTPVVIECQTNSVMLHVVA